MAIKDILDYFIEYESNERFLQSSLKGANGSEYTKEILENVGKLRKTIESKKTKKIYEEILKRKKYLAEKSIHEDALLLEIKASLQDRNMEHFNDILQFKSKKVEKDFYEHILPLISEEEITICYPILENDKKKQPVMTFIAKIENNCLHISKFYLNKTSLLVLIADSKNIDLKDVDHYFNNEILEVLKGIEMIQGQEQIDEILKLVDMVLQKYIGIKGIFSFNNGLGWRRMDKVFITTEQLKEMQEPPFRKEIAMVKDKIGKNDSSLIHRYLAMNKEQKKYDDILNQPRFHYGSYTDEYAVNKKQWDIITNVNQTQLLAVNGPPGTGKTTLLKEIIADKFVEKAKDLISVWEQSWIKVNAGSKREVYQSPFKGINKNSIVISSTNNNAVDNIGEELQKEISYFSEYMNDSNIKGAFCARLGKRENVDGFKGKILEPLLNGLENDETDQVNVNNEFMNVYQVLEGIYEKINHLIESASNLKKQLHIDHFEDIKNNTYKASNDINESLNQSLGVLTLRERELDEVNLKLLELAEEKKENEEYMESLSHKVKETYIVLEQFKSYQKMKILNVFVKKRKKFLEEYPTLDFIKSLIASEEKKKEDLEVQKQKLQAEEKGLTKQQNKIIVEIKEISIEVSNLKQKEKEIKSILSSIKDITIDKDSLEIELDINITDFNDIYILANNEKVLKMRKQLFDLSLVVHQEYIKKHKNAIIHNFKKINEENGWFRNFYNPKQEFGSQYEIGLRALWETLCMAFPVITTTLHSFHSNNFHMLPNLFDLMLVDESGQILPHYIVGPLYRANRAVIVGDVYQLEPIRLQDNQLIEKYKSIEEDMHHMICVKRNSVQSYSDARSDIYEELGKDKVGIILEEHRRCENRIAQFSNRFVYGSKLTIVKKDNHDKPFGRNLVAFDVRGKQRNDNVNELEMEICKRVIERLLEKGFSNKDIGVITPYKNQAVALRNTIKGIDIGTVHTFQGQEKRVVLFSSVIDKADQSRFIGSKPNMLNVAFTRAKEQLIWIGNVNAALKTNNYLYKAVDLIQKEGIIYSIYDTLLNKNSDGMQMEQAMRIFTNPISSERTPLNEYILEQFDGGIINGPSKHYDFLQNVLELAESSVTIISPWITNYVVDNKFYEKVTALLNKQVIFKIMFGYHQSEYSLKDIDKIAFLDYNQKSNTIIAQLLKNLYQLLGNHLVYKPPMHIKLLLIDQKYLVIGSYNWLSNNGTRKGAKDEISCIITNQRYIDSINEHIL